MNRRFNPNALNVRASFIILIVLALMLSNFPPLHSQSGFWTNLNPQTAPAWRAYHQMINAGDGKVILFGGGLPGGLYNDLWLFDLNTNNWYNITPEISPKPRKGVGFARLNDSLYILYGGDGDSLYFYNDVWILNMNDTTWTQIETKNLPPPRADMGLEPLDTNIVLLFGGKNQLKGEGRSDTWIFDYNNKEWKEIKWRWDDWESVTVPERREFPTLSRIDKGKVILYSGYNFGYLGDMWLFDLSTERWRKIKHSGGVVGRSQHGLANPGGNYLMLFGGTIMDSTYNTVRGYTDETWIYDIEDSLWTKLNLDYKPTGRRVMGLATIADNKVLMFAGESKSISKADTWLFTFEPTDVKEESKDIEFIQTSSYLIIKNIDESGGELYIYDIMGRAISNYSSFDISKSDEIRIPISHLNSGIYLLRINNQIEKFTIIK